MSAPEPYTISIPPSALEALHHKLAHAILPDEVRDEGWRAGPPVAEIARLLQRWRDGSFDWRDQERELNRRLPQYRVAVEVEGFGEVGVHFVHRRSEVQGAVPVLVVHGWPGSFVEVMKMLPLLTDPDSSDSHPSEGEDANLNGNSGANKSTVPAFHVVAPSLPNYGFSDGVTKKGFGFSQYAEVCHKLMLRLGYDRYVTQGGDIGTFVTRIQAVHYPRHILGCHISMPYAPQPPSALTTPLQYLRHLLTRYTPAERAGLARTHWFQTDGYAYCHLHETRPHTLGYALRDSPLALLAWIAEKLHDWTDAYPWSDDELLTWVSVYWHSVAGPQASLRVYREALATGSERERVAGWIPDVPLGVSVFPRDIYVPPDSWVRGLGPLVFLRRHERGGHFAAWECPELLVGDLREMCRGLVGRAE